MDTILLSGMLRVFFVFFFRFFCFEDISPEILKKSSLSTSPDIFLAVKITDVVVYLYLEAAAAVVVVVFVVVVVVTDVAVKSD